MLIKSWIYRVVFWYDIMSNKRFWIQIKLPPVYKKLRESYGRLFTN